MKKYTITIQETVVEQFEVEANSKREAREIAREKYYNEEFVLSPGEMVDRKMRVDHSGRWGKL